MTDFSRFESDQMARDLAHVTVKNCLASWLLFNNPVNNPPDPHNFILCPKILHSQAAGIMAFLGTQTVTYIVGPRRASYESSHGPKYPMDRSCYCSGQTSSITEGMFNVMPKQLETGVFPTYLWLLMTNYLFRKNILHYWHIHPLHTRCCDQEPQRATHKVVMGWIWRSCPGRLSRWKWAIIWVGMGIGRDRVWWLRRSEFGHGGRCEGADQGRACLFVWGPGVVILTRKGRRIVPASGRRGGIRG